MVDVNQFESLLCINSFPGVYELIFSYLDTQSLCNASLVSQEWNEFIGGSATIMKNFNFGINMNEGFQYGEGKKIREENSLEILNNSNRCFRSIKIKNFIQPNTEIVIFMEKHRWFSLVLESQFTKFPDLNPLCLRDLTSLEFKTIELSHVLNLLRSSPNLKHLKAVVMFCNRNDWRIVNKDQKIQLESLEVSLSDYLIYNARQLNDLFGTQHQLRRLDVSGIILDCDTLKMITQMPKLESLVVRKLYAFQDEGSVLYEMKSLKALKLLGTDFCHQRLFNTLMNFASNLTSLEVTELNQMRIELAGKCLTKLKQLQTTTFSFTDISNPDLFPELERVKVKNAMQLSYQRAIAEQVESEMTNFSICLYEEISKLPHLKVQDDQVSHNFPNLIEIIFL